MLASSEKNVALRLLGELPGGNSICHGDLHAANAVVGTTGNDVTLIDWGQAAIGNPLADVARTQLMNTTSWIGISRMTRWLAPLVRRVMDDFNQGYLQSYFSGSRLEPIEIGHWHTVMTAARLGEPMPSKQEQYLAQMIRRSLRT